MKIDKNKQGGFLDIIIMIVIVLLLMRYFGVTITGVIEWIKSLFYSVW